jgi:hypothetical protein
MYVVVDYTMGRLVEWEEREREFSCRLLDLVSRTSHVILSMWNV